jgi:hypothetical protein
VLDGWFSVTPSRLEEQRRHLSSEDRRRFFDGRAPGWCHALAPESEIPRRPMVAEALAKLRPPAGSRQALVLLVGPDGQGKTTALLQVAAALATEGRRVLMRSPGGRLDPKAVLALPADAPWVLVSDSADEVAGSVREAVEAVFAADRHDMHWLLSARDVDWKSRFMENSRTVEPPWERYADLWPALGNRVVGMAVSPHEAAAVVGAWQAAGGLGALGASGDIAAEARADAVVERSSKKIGLSDATLLGASLDLRYGATGIGSLLEESLGRLGGDPAAEAFLFAAAASVAGVDGVDLLVLADLVGVDRKAGDGLRERLADAGLAGGSGGALRPRHPALARAAVQRLDAAALEDRYRRLIRGTAATGNDVKALATGGAVMTCAPLLADKLEMLGVDPTVARQVACAAADEAEAALPEFLLFTVARARTYRDGGRPDESRAVLRDRIPDATGTRDWDMAGRAFLHELSVHEADVGQLPEAVILAGLALADADGLGQVTMADAKLALLSLGQACRQWASADGADLYRRQLRSCHHLGEKVTPKWDQKARFQFHTFEVAANEYAIPKTTAADALMWLADTVKTAKELVIDAEVGELASRLVPETAPLGFSHVEYTIGLGRLPWANE